MKKVMRIIFVLSIWPFVFVGFAIRMVKAAYKVGAILAQKFIDWV